MKDICIGIGLFIYKHIGFEIYKFANHYSLSYTIILYMFIYIYKEVAT